MSYTHLQVRSSYSLLNSTITIDHLVKKAKKSGFEALALTDEQVLYGAITFYKTCKKYGIKPIIGMSVYVHAEQDKLDEITLLAKDNHGYHDLIKLSTLIQQQEAKYIEDHQLAAYTKNCIGIFSEKQSSIFTNIQANDYEEAFKKLAIIKDMFIEGDFYVGIESSVNEETNRYEAVKSFLTSYSLPPVAINDVRYLQEKDVIAFDCLQAIKNNENWDGKNIPSAYYYRHLSTAAEMQHFFSFWPEAITNTERIEKKCEVVFDFNQRFLPSFPLPDGVNAHTWLENRCWEGLHDKYANITKTIRERLKFELNTIKAMQFSDYFLIVADFIQYAKEQPIVVGPGRGSAAGSLVAYVLEITDIDPIKYDLLFERFLNPERMTMPDIDIDFSDWRRDEVIDYVQHKYGRDHVAQIITFGTFAARSLIRELIKTMNINQQDASFILRHIPVQAKQRISEIITASDELKNYIKTSEPLKLLFTVAVKLEGIPRHVSTHAAGIVITEKPLNEYIPLTMGTGDSNLTQFPMNDLEAIGLLKIDLLGLRNLTLLEKVLQTIRYISNDDTHLKNLPPEDNLTFSMLQHGKTNGVFQLESQGMKRVLQQLKPTEFEDIVAVNALYRPGPMEYIPTFIRRKHGEEAITYPHPDLAPILSKTYGVLVYQEQIMQIANRIAGFSLGKADILRRAVSKKQEQLMAEQKTDFITGCVRNGYSKKVAEEIFEWIVRFSNYGFNRSHAVAYSRISYQLAYLKAHYPAAFFAELLSSSVNQQEKLQSYIRELKTLHLDVLPPSINKSFGKYAVEGNKIRMGLLQVKGLGKQAVQEIIRVRKERPFKNLFDFCLRVSSKAVNRQTLEVLIMVGAFDESNQNRASLLATIDQAMEQGELFKEFLGQPNLFQDQIELEGDYVDIEDFSQFKKLADEKEFLGVYMSSHPLQSYRMQLKQHGHVSLSLALTLAGKKNIKSAAVIQSIKTIRTKRGDPMAFLTLGDESGEMEAVVFPELYRNVNRWLKEETLVLIEGNLESRNQGVQWLLSSIIELTDDRLEEMKSTRLFIKLTGEASEAGIEKLKQMAHYYPGNIPVIIFQEQNRKTYQLSEAYFLQPTTDCLKDLKAFFGKDSVVLDKG
ncbi:hypothetical protein M948_11800 [Virgibacillus sp. CM-4]|uniref:DNA polymerase III subunit alpha n=1 Tax=Virgibacillus sp. CM-4 TaxID=1354277 RepID=UPI0003883F4F|nr:DNA polymerase III subunit alpha [Virgibacillus sp. CM-4]EQB35719.1 hypothetical protein M948_11800 [Virgibacillus sp. CM-4]